MKKHNFVIQKIFYEIELQKSIQYSIRGGQARPGVRSLSPVPFGGCLIKLQYALDEMGSHFQPNCKHFCPESHFIEIPFYREKIARLFNFCQFPFPDKSAFWSRKPCHLTSFLSTSSHFCESLTIFWPKSHFIEFSFYRGK